jgi:hypothetical protein
MFGGHVLDERIGFASQLGFDNGRFRLNEFAGIFGLPQTYGSLKIGHFFGGYSLFEATSPGKLEFVEKTSILTGFTLGPVTGVSWHTDKKNPLSWEVGIYDNTKLEPLGSLGRSAIAASVGYNHNYLDPTIEPDFEGGPLRLMGQVGGILRAQLVDSWQVTGYSGNVSAMLRVNRFSVNSGFFIGVPEAPKSPESTAAKPVFKMTAEDLQMAGYLQGGYLFDNRYGLAARYAVVTPPQKGTPSQEVFVSASIYQYGHNLKFQVDGGGKIQKEFAPQVRAQLQLAF